MTIPQKVSKTMVLGTFYRLTFTMYASTLAWKSIIFSSKITSKTLTKGSFFDEKIVCKSTSFKSLFWECFYPFWDRFWAYFGPHDGPQSARHACSIGVKSSWTPCKPRFDAHPRRKLCRYRSGIDFGMLLGPFWGYFWLQNRCSWWWPNGFTSGVTFKSFFHAFITCLRQWRYLKKYQHTNPWFVWYFL